MLLAPLQPSLCIVFLLSLLGTSDALGQPSPDQKKEDTVAGKTSSGSTAPQSEAKKKDDAQSGSSSQKADKGSSDSSSKKSSDAQESDSPTESKEAGEAQIILGEEKRLPSDRVPPRQRSASRIGATGLREVMSADPGPQGTVRLSLSGGGFSSENFLTKGVKERSSRLDLSIAYTPIEWVETFVNLRSLSYSNPLASPKYIQSQGDLNLGAKVGYFWDGIGAGLSLGTQLVSDPIDGGWLGSATNFDVHALFTVDLNRGEDPLPFRFLLDIHFTKENTEALTEGLGEEPSLIQEWGYQSARYDRLMLHFGLEAPTQYVSPFVEYHIGTPFLVEMPRMGRYSRVFAFESVPHYFAAGLRGYVLPQVSIELGGTLGMSDAPFTGVPATPPWSMWGGVTYTLDPRPEVIEREVKIKPPPPPKPKPSKPLGIAFSIKVLDATTKKAIPGARLSFQGGTLSDQVSDEAGQFRGYRVTKGSYRFEVSAPGYLPKKSGVKIPKSRTRDFKGVIRLKPDPLKQRAQLEISLEATSTASADKRLEYMLYGPETHKGVLTVATPIKLGLPAGEYALVVRDERGHSYQDFLTLGSDGSAKRVIQLDMLKGEGDSARSGDKDGSSGPDIQSDRPLKGKTKWVKYDLKRKRIGMRRAIVFKGEGSRLTSSSIKALKGLAEVLNDDLRIRRIVVMVHTHSRGDSRADKRLGYQRAQAIKRVLTGEGVEGARVSILSFGSDRSIASNLTRQGRTRNQRVLLKIKTVKLK